MTASRQVAAEQPEDRFRAMFARHHPAVFGYAARRVGRQDAADVAAETFAVAWRRIRRVPTEPATLPWLYGVARNVVSNHLRTQRRAGRLAARAAAAAGPEAAVQHPVIESLDLLADGDREILLLAAWEGLTTAEIGTALGCSPNTAAVRLHRARRRLADAMEGELS